MRQKGHAKMNKVIISVAPVAGDATSITAEGVANEVIKAYKTGAAMVHLHAKDKNGKLTKDITLLEETLKLIRQDSDIIIEASTGGISELTIQERCAPLENELVEVASLNCGSVNLGEYVYHNSFEEIRYCARKITQKHIVPDFEVFEIGMLNNVEIVGKEVPFKDPLLYNIVLGQKGAMPATLEALIAFKSFIPKGALWSLTHYGRQDFMLLSAAAAMGAPLLRIGFEDSTWYEGSQKARDNAMLVERLVSIIRSMGMEPATPSEAREILKLKERGK
jgi:3-keto-5-aminohexanoate cleavage enzyme